MYFQVDVAKFAVIAFTVPSGECASTFDRFDIGDDGAWTPLFRESGPCDDALPRLVAVSVDREALVGGVTFRYGDAVLRADPDYSLVAARWGCGSTDQPTFAITIDLPADAGIRAEVLDGDVVTGWGTLSNVGGNAGTYGIEFGMTGSPSPASEVVVTDAATGNEVARMSLGHLPIPTCG